MPASELSVNSGVTVETTTGYGNVIYYALNTGFIDKNAYAMSSHVPRLLTNEKGARVVTELKDELSRCRSFTFSVAFVSSEIILGLKQNFYDFAARPDAEQSYIATSTMNLFNKPRAFEELYKLEQETQGKIKIKIFGAELHQEKTRLRKYHPKGYYFSHGEYSSVIVVSSNLTNPF
jgi:HKD family nuclease